MIGLEKEDAVVSIEAIFNSGNKTSGNKATTGIGIASLIHSPIIKAPTARTLLAAASTWKGFTKNRNREIERLTQIPIYGLEIFKAMQISWLYYTNENELHENRNEFISVIRCN